MHKELITAENLVIKEEEKLQDLIADQKLKIAITNWQTYNIQPYAQWYTIHNELTGRKQEYFLL